MCFKEHIRIRIASIYPHTCTSWFDCMIFFSMDPLFDFAKYAIQVCLEIFPTWAPHKLYRSRKKKKEGKLKIPWWGNKHLSDLIVPFEYCMWAMLYFQKNLQVTKMWKWINIPALFSPRNRPIRTIKGASLTPLNTPTLELQYSIISL